MKLLVGLGNPGKRYRRNRHNFGFMVLDALAEDFALDWRLHSKSNSLLTKLNSDVLLAKPQALMNASGIALAKLAGYYKIKPKDIWVIHDELDLPLGQVKVKTGGGSAGHRGVESIVEQLSEKGFVRFRLGIGHPRPNGQEVEDYVLSNFAVEEKPLVEEMIKTTIESIKATLSEGD